MGSCRKGCPELRSCSATTGSYCLWSHKRNRAGIVSRGGWQCTSQSRRCFWLTTKATTSQSLNSPKTPISQTACSLLTKTNQTTTRKVSFCVWSLWGTDTFPSTHWITTWRQPCWTLMIPSPSLSISCKHPRWSPPLSLLKPRPRIQKTNGVVLDIGDWCCIEDIQFLKQLFPRTIYPCYLPKSTGAFV